MPEWDTNPRPPGDRPRLYPLGHGGWLFTNFTHCYRYYLIKCLIFCNFSVYYYRKDFKTDIENSKYL